MKFLKLKSVLIIVVFQVVNAEYNDGLDKDNGDSGVFYRNREDQSSLKQKEPGGQCDSCGTLDGKLKGQTIEGKPVKNDYPWIVSVLYQTRFKCGGVLIGSDAILTSANCVIDKQKASSVSECNGVKVSPSCFLEASKFHVALMTGSFQKVKSIKYHPKYSHDLQINNLLILLLENNVKCSSRAMPVCLPENDDLRANTSMVVAGFGRNTPATDPMRESSVKAVDPKECVENQQPKNTKNTIVCATKSYCYDRGNPLMVQFGSKVYLVGVVSLGKSGKCDSEKPKTYTKVQPALPFIRKHVKNIPT